MKRWTDSVIKQHVDELIEESFLLSLSEEAIQEYFRCFLDACDCVLRENISVHNDIRTTGIKIALLKARLLITQSALHVKAHPGNPDSIKSNHKSFAEQIVKIKRIIIKLFENVCPDCARALHEEMEIRKIQRKRYIEPEEVQISTLVKAGYYILLLTAVFMVWFIAFR